ncbi:Hsp70 family protein [Pseudarthrobacter sulfonivorans]|uniref:Hsp70 family protein n=1 Tax=Pseudarthrobacter sulfonivorans TaxID=121292 RepID=UPI00210745C3|nr:Hsp70 family protein [Pseudarthrobacter sulfonivorans]
MSYVLAIDVGTSFTAAAIAKNDLGAPSVPESLPLGLRGTSVPSVVYYPEEGPLLIGEAAERRGLDDPGRVVREFKRRIGDSVPLAVGTLSLQAEDIFATMAHWVVDRAAEREGAPPSEIIITHPAAWGGHRTSAVLAALAARGLHNVTLISEPEAAALYYASQVRVDDGSTIAVYDLGGGTFDTAILRKDGRGHFDLLGSPDGIDGLGGADFDAEVLRHVAAHTGDALAAIDPEDPGALAALARLKRECVEAKEALSADSEANIAVFLPGAQQQVRLVRSEFEAMIDEPIRETVDALERSLEQLGLEPDDLTAVLLIGGSSRIPLVAQLISAQLDRPIAVDADPKSSICLGAAVAALRAAPAPVTGPAEPAGPARVAGPAAAAASAETAAGIPEIPGPTDIAFEPHGVVRRASWSRKSGAAVGSLAGTAALAGDGARGFRSGHAGSESAGSGQAGAGGAPAGRAHGAKSGSHAPRPAIRLTAVAAGAALFTILTATAAGSPEGLGSLTAMFAPPAAPADAAPGGTMSGAVSGAPGGSPMAGIGIEASAKPGDAPFTSAGLEASAAPAGKPSPSSAAPAPAAVATTGGPAAGHAGPGPAPDGPGTSGAPTEVAAPGTLPPTTPATVPPSETQPPVTDPPATTAPTPEPTPPPTTATPTPDLTPPPTPGPTPTPSLEPVPTTQPQPTATETTAPAPQAIQTSASADPTTVPGG